MYMYIYIYMQTASLQYIYSTLMDNFVCLCSFFLLSLFDAYLRIV